MKNLSWILQITAKRAALASLAGWGLASLSSCSPSAPPPRLVSADRVSIPVGFEAGPVSPAALYRQVNVNKQLLSPKCRARTGLAPMNPRYITIHSTQNWSPGADSLRHALALKNGALGKVCWHYTADQSRVIQHLPDRLQGRHADGHGPGNQSSIGIEMCENPGNSLAATIDRTAKLTAILMVEHNIPLSHVVPHYHWPREWTSPAHKNCPHFLLDNGKPGAKWAAFQRKVNIYHRMITADYSAGQWAAR
jgi:N-acetylmuramoyl-L-alanine amidase